MRNCQGFADSQRGLEQKGLMAHRARAAEARSRINRLAGLAIRGRVSGVGGLSAELSGLSGHVAVGDRLSIQGRGGTEIPAEVVGFRGSETCAMAFGGLEGLGPGSHVLIERRAPGLARYSGPHIPVTNGWLGRVIDPLGRPLDGKGALPRSGSSRPVRSAPPPPALRDRLGPRLDLGVRALDVFVTCCKGQRLGLFAGSGVGKSTLLAMLARNTACDVAVLALVGERGREVREFIEDDLGRAGLERSVVVVATSDNSPLIRREAAYAAMAVAEHFRDQGKAVLLLMDSVTRFCLALREIGLSVGEPPATRGYPPSVFSELPRLLERAGPGISIDGKPAGTITGLFTVLVEGDDHNEPIADGVRGILDGHVVLDRRIADGGRYPAIDILRSLSRTVPACLNREEISVVRKARAILSLHQEISDLVRLGAYRAGSDSAVDEALLLTPRIEAVLRQDRNERSDASGGFSIIQSVIAGCADAS